MTPLAADVAISVFNNIADTSAKVVHGWINQARDQFAEIFILNNNLALLIQMPNYMPSVLNNSTYLAELSQGVALTPEQLATILSEFHKMILYIVYRLDRATFSDDLLTSLRAIANDKADRFDIYTGPQFATLVPLVGIPHIKSMVMDAGRITITDDPFDDNSGPGV